MREVQVEEVFAAVVKIFFSDVLRSAHCCYAVIEFCEEQVGKKVSFCSSDDVIIDSGYARGRVAVHYCLNYLRLRSKEGVGGSVVY